MREPTTDHDRAPVKVVVRRAERDEATALADLWLRARRAAAPAIPPPVHADEDVRRWFDDVVLGRMVVLVAEVGGERAGVVALQAGWVEQLYVDPPHQARGVGTALLAVAKEVHPDGLELWTFQANAGARRFYERHGFTAVQETAGDNEEGAPDVRYRWAGDA